MRARFFVITEYFAPAPGANDMDNEQQPSQEVENPAETTTQTDVTEVHQAGTEGGVDKQPESPYAKQLEELQKEKERLETELAKKDEIIEHKNRAIDTTKEKLKEIKSKTPDEEIEERLFKRLELKNAEKEIDAKISALTGDEAEAKVIKHHLQNSIVRSGDVERDLRAAIALANADKVWEQRANRAMEERREDFMTAFRPSSVRGETRASITSDPIRRQAEELVRAINPDAVKHLKNVFEN